MTTTDPTEKVRLTFKVAESWRAGEIAKIGHGTPPDQPFREETLEFVAPGKARRLGKGGSLVSAHSDIHSSRAYSFPSSAKSYNRNPA